VLLRAARRRLILPLAGVAAVAAVATTVALTPVQTTSNDAIDVPSVAELAQSGAQSYSANLVAGAANAAAGAQAAGAQEPVTGRGDAVSIEVATPSPTPQPAGTGSGGGSTAGVVASGDPKQIAHDMVLAQGWGEGEYQCLVNLWQKESGWNPHAENSSSGAYGIPQALPGSKMASAGSDWQDNPATQIAWGLGYIKGVYGTPCGAWGHSQSNNWY